MNLNKVAYTYPSPNKFLKRLPNFIEKYHSLPKLLRVTVTRFTFNVLLDSI